ncbi:MAG: calcium/sodium antiporter, partial [Pseudomonadales bacterium]|nr:calcium/sodium antiporter [Pseudomonadales bacterium]
GIIGLPLGAQLTIIGATDIARSFGISETAVGLTIVALGTSAPEIAVSVGAATRGVTDLAIGNVVGSNVLNILLVLGASALITPLLVAQQLIRQEVPIMIGASLLLFALALDQNISRMDGFLLVMLLLADIALLIWQSRRASATIKKASGSRSRRPTKAAWDDRVLVQVALVAGGLILLILGADWFVRGAVKIAVALGLSELVVGLTIVAFGTSLPEIATSLLAAARGERDLAVGNVIGSNIINILGCLGLSALVASDGIPVSTAMLSFDLPVMIAVAVACLPIFFTGNLISRWEGGVFVAYYCAYTAYIILAAQDHEGSSTFGFVMAWVVIPLTALTLAIISYRQLRRRSA